MADVFISYKSERRAAAEHLSRILELNGYTVWFDYGLMSGRDFSRQIERELRAAKAVMVLWCDLSRESDWVNNEALLAKRLGKYLPVWIDKVDLPLDFIRDDTLDLTGWDGAPRSHVLDRLFDQIEKLSGKPQAPLMAGLREFEGTWRRYGSPKLLDFPLSGPLPLPDELRLPEPPPKRQPEPAPVPPAQASEQAADVSSAHQPEVAEADAIPVVEIAPQEVAKPGVHAAPALPASPKLARSFANWANLGLGTAAVLAIAGLAALNYRPSPAPYKEVFGSAQERLHKSFIVLAVDDNDPLRFGMNRAAIAAEAAWEEALSNCRVAGGTRCRILTAVSEGCLAFAASRASPTASGYYAAATLDYTRLAAENVCKAKANGDGCRVLASACW